MGGTIGAPRESVNRHRGAPGPVIVVARGGWRKSAQDARWSAAKQTGEMNRAGSDADRLGQVPWGTLPAGLATQAAAIDAKYQA
jgi:hypothetical protein